MPRCADRSIISSDKSQEIFSLVNDHFICPREHMPIRTEIFTELCLNKHERFVTNDHLTRTRIEPASSDN